MCNVTLEAKRVAPGNSLQRKNYGRTKTMNILYERTLVKIQAIRTYIATQVCPNDQTTKHTCLVWEKGREPRIMKTILLKIVYAFFYKRIVHLVMCTGTLQEAKRKVTSAQLWENKDDEHF